jgi:hypothetical protein
MDKYLDTYKLPKLSQEHINSLNRFMSNEIEAAEKSLPTNKSSGPDGFIVEFYKNFIEELTPMLLKILSKTRRKKCLLPNSFYEPSITLILKSDKDTTKKKTNCLDEHTCKIFH